MGGFGMKGVLILTALLALSACQQKSDVATSVPEARAEAADKPASQQELEALCAADGQLAETIMKAHQSGVPMESAMKLALESDEPLRTTQVQWIKAAYDSPRYGSDVVQQRSIAEFRDKAYADCARKMM